MWQLREGVAISRIGECLIYLLGDPAAFLVGSDSLVNVLHCLKQDVDSANKPSQFHTSTDLELVY